MLGLTVACARCHDHKYDPISQKDYYALYGIFESTRYPYPGCEKDKSPYDLVSLVSAGEAAHGADAVRMLVGGAPGKRANEMATRAGPHAYAVAEGAPHDAALHKRGDPEVRGEVVPRRFLTVLGGQPVPAGAGSGRLQLAEWLTDAKNPLTARVFVNRVWQGHFGRRARGHAERLRHPRQAADPPGVARLAGPPVRRIGLVGQGAAPADRVVRRLPPLVVG